MVKITTEQVKDFFAAGGRFVAEGFANAIEQKAEDAFAEAIEVGISNTIAALYDADVEDEEIVRVMNNQWGINPEDTKSRLKYEKGSAAACALRNYMEMQGFSPKDIQSFMKQNQALLKIRHDGQLWLLRRNPEKLMKEVQKPLSKPTK